MFKKVTLFLKKMYDAVVAAAEKPQAVWILALVSFAESSCFPIPPDVILIPMMIAKPKNAFKYAAICTLASVVGGAAGYAIGLFLYDTVAVPVFEFYGYTDKLKMFIDSYNKYGAWIVAGAGFTPFPYKVITITSGMTHLNFGIFMLTSVLSRGARFFLLAALLWKFGAPIQTFIDKNLGWLATFFFLLLVGGLLAAKGF